MIPVSTVRESSCRPTTKPSAVASVFSRDILQVVVLIVVTAALGIYLIWALEIISRDGVYYIDMAKQLTTHPEEVIQGRPFGYPLLILTSHKFVGLLMDGATNHSWRMAAQVVSIVCRVGSLIPMYLIGRRLLGHRRSLQALWLFVLLPLPAFFGADILRDWPYLLLLTTGLCVLLRAQPGAVAAYALAGFVSGLAMLIRTEGMQIILYALGWLAWQAWSGHTPGLKWRNLTSACVLLLGFAFLAVPYYWVRVGHAPYEWEIMRIARHHGVAAAAEFSCNGNGFPAADPALCDAASSNWGPIYMLFIKAGENLLWYYLLPLGVGLTHRLRSRRTSSQERFYIIAILILSTSMLVGRYYLIGPQISTRYVLPLLAITALYIPHGFRILGANIEMRIIRRPSIFLWGRTFRWATILMAAGMVLCLPKLLKPAHTDKTLYLQAAQWLRDNSPPQAKLAADDQRITFYAERAEGNTEIGFNYVARVLERGDNREIPPGWREVFTAEDHRASHGKRVVVYKTP